MSKGLLNIDWVSANMCNRNFVTDDTPIQSNFLLPSNSTISQLIYGEYWGEICYAFLRIRS